MGNMEDGQEIELNSFCQISKKDDNYTEGISHSNLIKNINNENNKKNEIKKNSDNMALEINKEENNLKFFIQIDEENIIYNIPNKNYSFKPNSKDKANIKNNFQIEVSSKNIALNDEENDNDDLLKNI